MYTKDDVARLVDELGKRDFGDPKPELGEPYMFGLALDIFDPLSGQVIAVCRPHRSDVGAPEVLLTADQVVTAVAQARVNYAHVLRSNGFGSPEEHAAYQARMKEQRDLDAKHATERAELEAKQAESTAALAEKSQPKAEPKAQTEPDPRAKGQGTRDEHRRHPA